MSDSRNDFMDGLAEKDSAPPPLTERYATNMTIRQAFVMAAMQGLCACSAGFGRLPDIDGIPEQAIEIADATLAALDANHEP